MFHGIRALRSAILPLTFAFANPALAAGQPASAPDPSGVTDSITVYPAAAAGDGVTTGGYNLSRWAEDWQVMRDPARRKDPLDRLKYLPLDSDGDVYLTLSGELRLRVNQTTNPNLREGPAQRQDITRIVGGADLHVGPHFRAYAEIVHGGLSGVRLGTPVSTLRDDLAVQQAFVEGNFEVGGVALGARYGRQEFTDGPNLLVSQRDNNTIRYTLNGIRAWARGSRVRIDLFDLKPTAYGTEGTGDDTIDHARRFSGVTMGLVLPTTWFGESKLYFDPYLWRRRNLVGAWAGRIGPAVRYYGGTRLWGDVGPVAIDWTVNHQWGHFMDQQISAWQAFFAQTYRIGQGKTAPRVGFHFDYASGGGGYGNGKLRNAYAPFGNNVYYSYQLFLTPSNLVTLAPTVAFSPIKDVRVTAEYELAWRATRDDAVYRANGQALAGTRDVRDHKVADIARAQMVWTISPRLSLTGRYEHLAAGPSLTRAGFSSSDFVAGWLSFRF
jgi:hypothetical protein